MPFWLQFLLFFIPGILIYYGVFYGTPKLVNKKVPVLYAFWFWLWFPVLLLLPLSIGLYLFLEDGTFTVEAVQQRFRLQPFSTGDWLWIGLAVLLTIFFDQILEPVGKVLAKHKWLSPPEYLPAPFHPLKKFSFPPKQFFGVTLSGNWKLLAVFIPLHLLAMFSEEMMWRGYLLPIQEAMFGGNAWMINGLLWAWVLHIALKWHVIGMIPGMLIAPLIAQYTQSTWASFAVHAIGNAPLWIILLIGVLSTNKEAN
ncbi:CAAX protease self-immunity [Evansella caseinilytica]|uniref:CAAX protease self-immunity n=1 Tax=Evansella caseinilytica TaxID=1503961 RepID=A0A1H3SNS6_9BACI|nr:CPBP family intramembrane glutamic endopeptidase [Evansella caseinilytica]SDZ39328.1 CAAX protease self-immunity [Evansella caseinilytica]